MSHRKKKRKLKCIWTFQKWQISSKFDFFLKGRKGSVFLITGIYFVYSVTGLLMISNLEWPSFTSLCLFLTGREEKLALWWDDVFILLCFNILLNNDIFYSLKVGQWVNLITYLWKHKELKYALGFSGDKGLSEMPEKWDSIFPRHQFFFFLKQPKMCIIIL